MVLVRDGMLGDGVVRKCLRIATRLDAASPSAASTPAPAFATAFTFPASSSARSNISGVMPWPHSTFSR